MENSTVLIGSDHAGFEFKEKILNLLSEVKWEDVGTHGSKSVDYPDFAIDLCKRVVAETKRGILICGSGIGMSIAANKMKGIRAALVANLMQAKLSREHNDSNVLCLAGRFIAPEYGAEMIKAWLETDFAAGRHQRRVDKIMALD